MCLKIDKEKTKEHSKVIDKRFIFYKVYKINFISSSSIKQLSTLYQEDKIKTNIVIAKGDLDLNLREITNYNSDYSYYKSDFIGGGCIHAWTNKKIGSDIIRTTFFNNNLIQLSIEVHSDDIIAYGQNEDVCFFNYKFTKQSIKKLKSLGINF